MLQEKVSTGHIFLGRSVPSDEPLRAIGLGLLGNRRQYCRLDRPAQDPTTEQKGIDLVAGVLLAGDHDSHNSVIAEAVGDPDAQNPHRRVSAKVYYRRLGGGVDREFSSSRSF